MNQEIVDYKLQSFLKNKLAENKFAWAKQLKSLKFCSVRPIKAPMFKSTVFIIANKKTAKVWGVQSCKNPWACPVCSARRMAKESSKIASAIELLEAEHQKAFMLTLGVPHLKSFSAKIVFEILRTTWKNFSHQCKSKNQTDTFSKFKNEFNCTHHIRVGEFTYGKNGFHPHYHCLFFVDQNKINSVLDWEQKLSESWFNISKRVTIKILTREFKNQNKPLQDYINFLRGYDCQDKTIKQFVENFFANSEYKKNGRPAAFISKNKDNSILIAKSSQYICGWGADKELTGNLRKQASHEGHYTPHQLLEQAYELKRCNPEESDKLVGLYLEYALATYKHYRVRMSNQLKQKIIAWQQRQQFTETLKKKAGEHLKEVGYWKIIAWFNPEQWYLICQLNIVHEILQLATKTNPTKQIKEFLLEFYGIVINFDNKPSDTQFFENKIFNFAA